MKANNFKTGDKVVCVRNTGFARLKVGEMYTVTAVYGERDALCLYGVIGVPAKNRFRHATWAELNPYENLLEDALEAQEIYTKLNGG